MQSTSAAAPALQHRWGEATTPPSPSRPPPNLRIVVPACSAAGSLERCLDALVVAARGLDAEIVLVDEGDNGDLCALAARDSVHILPGTQARKAGVTRNRGAEGFRGQIIVFVDSDVVVSPEALRRLVEPLLAGRADATVGRYGTRVDGLGFAQAYKQLHLAHVYGRAPGYLRNEFWSALGAIRVEAFKAVGGFSSGFAGASGEDTELGQRLTGAGLRVLAVPEADAVHLKPLTVASLYRNDLRKGLTSATLLLGSGTRLTDFRHSRRIDMAAVACSWLLPAALAVGLLPHLWPLPVAVAIGWAFARRGHLQAFAEQSFGFRLKAVPVMLGLDALRGFCFLGGLARALPARLPARVPASLSARTGGHR